MTLPPPSSRMPISPALGGKRRRGRWWTFRLLAATVIPTLVLGVIELGLRWTGVGYTTRFVVPSPSTPDERVDNYEFAWRFFPRALARESQPIRVTALPAKGTHRLVVLGESAAMGDPEPAYGLPRLLQAVLELTYPDESFEIINAAVTAINSHVILPIARDCRQLEPQAWVIYLGNNEVHGPYGAGTVFGANDAPMPLIRAGLAIREWRIGQFLSREWSAGADTVPEAWGGMEMFINSLVRPDSPALARVYSNFERNLHDILATTTARQTPVIMSTAATNLRDCAPFISVHHAQLDAAALAAWQKEFDAGVAARDRADWPAALASFREARKLNSLHAETAYQLARCEWELREYEPAAREYEAARDLDALRFRADSRLHEIATDVARQYAPHVRVVNGVNVLNELSPGGVAGDEFFFEHVHLNFSGNYQLARRIAAELVVALQLPLNEAREWPTEVACAERLGLTPYHASAVLREVMGRLRKPPFAGQSNAPERESRQSAALTALSRQLTSVAARRAAEHFGQLIQQHPREWLLRKQYATLLESQSQYESAAQQWSEIASQLPHYGIAWYQCGALYNRAKKWTEACDALQTAVKLRPDHARAWNSLGICLAHLRAADQADLAFERAVTLQPQFAEARYNWGLVLAERGQLAQAKLKYQEATRADKDYLPAHVKLGEDFVSAHRYAEAEPHYRAVVRLKPTDVAARVNLGLLYVKLGRRADAIEQLERAVALEPQHTLARRSLEHARSQPVSNQVTK